MKIRRDVNSIPARSAAETWTVISKLVTGPGSKDATELDAVASVIASIIADEIPAREPFIFSGVGPRVVIYCAFGTGAVTDEENISSLASNPTAGDWSLRVPCDKENMSWVKEALTKKSARVTVYDVNSPETEDEDKQAKAAATEIKIDWSVGGIQ